MRFPFRHFALAFAFTLRRNDNFKTKPSQDLSIIGTRHRKRHRQRQRQRQRQGQGQRQKERVRKREREKNDIVKNFERESKR